MSADHNIEMATPKKARLDYKIGYIQNVSPLKVSRNNNKYFNATIQTVNDYEDVVSFKPESHDTFKNMSAARTPVCLQNTETIPSIKKKGHFSIKFSSKSKLSSPDETITFPFRQRTQDESKTETIMSIYELEQPYCKVNLSCKILMVLPPVKIKDLQKMDTTVSDKTGTIELSFWNDQISLIKQGKSYNLTELSIRRFQDKLTLTTTINTKVEEIDAIMDAHELEKEMQWLQCDTVEVSITKNCIFCKEAVMTSESLQTIKCQKCYKKMVVTKLVEVVLIKLTLQQKELTLETSLLEKIKPKWKALLLNELEDFLLLNTAVKVCRNRIVDIKLTQVETS